MTANSNEHAVRQVITYMHVNLGQDLTIDDMARTAMFSKFHFTRIFRDVTGTSPGRFLSALRMQEAKKLLVETNFSVADISSQVGYSSVGTFSSRFKACVGLSPSAYRARRGVIRDVPTAPRRGDIAQRRSVHGRVRLAPDCAPGPVFVGLFPGCVLQGRPVCWTVMEAPGTFELRGAPAGTWYLLARSVAHGHDRLSVAPDAPRPPLVGRHGPLTIRAGALLMPADMLLRPADLLDPPVLLAQLAPRQAPGLAETAT